MSDLQERLNKFFPEAKVTKVLDESSVQATDQGGIMWVNLDAMEALAQDYADRFNVALSGDVILHQTDYHEGHIADKRP